METYFVGDWGCLIHSEALTALKELPSDSVDALCTDPPAGIAFMPAMNAWDHDRGGRSAWVTWLSEIMQETYRVLKPGAYGLVWAHTKTSHWTALALEDAGFTIRECIFHLHAQGGAKCLNVAKAIDEKLGAEPTVVGPKPWKNQDIRGGSLIGGRDHEQLMDTTPTTPEAKKWDGWYSGVKSCVECWWLVQKPISEKNIASNVLAWGVGALNVGATSVSRAEDDVPGWHESGSLGRTGFVGTDTFRIRDMSSEEVKARRAGKGRFTPNLVLSHHDLCVRVGTTRVKGCPAQVIQGGKDGGGYDVGSGDGSRRSVFDGYGDENGLETVDLWACVPGCPVREIDSQSGVSRSRKGKPRSSKQPGAGWGMTHTGSEYNDQGGASRFYPQFRYQAKPGRSEKERGLDHLEYATLTRVNPGGLEREERFAPVQVKNNHTTVKSIPLCRWLSKLICPPGGLLLDPFTGSGSIAAACVLEGFRYIGIEQGNPPEDDRYIRIALGRMEYWSAKRETE